MARSTRIRSPRTYRSTLIPFAVAVALAAPALLLQGCGTESARAAESAPAPAAPQVTVAEVVQREITDYEEFTGRFEAVERVELRPRVSGYIESVRFKEGAEVKRGDLLFVIDPRPYAAALKRAQADLTRAQSAQRQARSERERAEKLLALRALSQEEFDARTSGSERAEADVLAAQAAVDTAALELGFTQVRAPISGVVGKAEITTGNFVTSGDTRLTTLVSVDPIYVRFQGDESSYLRYVEESKGAGAGAPPVWVGLANDEGHPHDGSLVFVDNELDSATGTISVRARLDNAQRQFTPGMFARVKLGGRASRPAVLIRDSAIGTDQNRRFVFVVTQENTVEYRPIELGALQGDLRVVSSGLQQGERVVVNGLQRVRPGATVAPQVVAMQKDASESLVAGNRQ
jgi:RND family efflux transporter MFP subunit